MLVPTKNQIIAASSGWIAALLNFIPGLGTGYLYQRRWKAYWITTISSALWIYFDLLRELSKDIADPAVKQGNNAGIYGLLIISTITALEAAQKVKQEREKIDEESNSSAN